MEMRELVLASQEGDIDSFIQLIRQREDTVFRIARVYTQNIYDAEDCISDAVIHAYDKIKQLKSPDKFYCWFISILINICRKKYKAKITETEYIPEIHDCIDEKIIKCAEDSILVENILNYLKQNEREILVLRYLEDFTLEDIAKALGISEGTVKSRLSRIISKIKSRHKSEEVKAFER